MGLWSWLTGKTTSRDTSGGTCSDNGSSIAVAEGEKTVTGPPEAAAPDTDQEPKTWWAPEGAVLTEPVELQRPDLPTEARALENLLVSHFDGHDLTLPPLLHVAEVLLPELSNASCDLGKVATGLAEDQVIAASVLRMANSPLYRGLNKIAGLRPAVNRLGIRAIRTLLMHESLRAATFFQKRGNTDYATTLWRRSLACACIMRALAELTGVDKEDAFLLGLLHDIGNVLVLRIAFGMQFAPCYDIDADVFEYLCYETHQEFGELIATNWALPPNLMAVICDHHAPPAPDDPLRVSRLQVQLTDMIASLLDYAPYVPYNLLDSRAVRELHLAGHSGFMAFLTRLPDEVEESVGLL